MRGACRADEHACDSIPALRKIWNQETEPVFPLPSPLTPLSPSLTQGWEESPCITPCASSVPHTRTSRSVFGCFSPLLFPFSKLPPVRQLPFFPYVVLIVPDTQSVPMSLSPSGLCFPAAVLSPLCVPPAGFPCGPSCGFSHPAALVLLEGGQLEVQAGESVSGNVILVLIIYRGLAVWLVEEEKQLFILFFD